MTASRFGGALLATLALAGAGVASGQQSLFVAAAIPLAFVVYGALSTPGDAGDLRVSRTLSKESPLPGDRVTVTVTVENASETVFPDVRVADGAPDGLRVVDGATTGGFALPAGETATFSYTVVADRGQFPFDAPTVRVRGAGAAVERTDSVAADGADVLHCRVSVADIPLRRQTTAHSGQLPTDTGGPGIEFHSTRDYQHGDPVARINWRRYAKTGELSTVNYRERRSAAVVLVVDARDACDVAARSGTPSGASLSAYAAAQAVRPLEGAGHQVGLAAFGVGEGAGSDPAWVPPGNGDAHHARLATVLDAAVESDEGESSEPTEDDAPEPPEQTAQAAADGGNAWLDDATEDDARVHRLADLLPSGTQVVVCSPALDDFPVAVTRRLLADGHRVTALSPDVTATDTPGRTLAAADRALALGDLDATSAQVVDWTPGESLASAVARTTTAVEEGQR
ncbi:DUF58 domain-containing protein [Halobacterium litoreum]|uniref:DUF58 domain-containing protein n=1 Tax=Halobacterium litoreum TaxID=2039234 RepID=A0ABD5NCQ6_9EURY|nr:DUF58 domain-containing protein [Halobacterium litoreum]UHH14358.1 DUF58 domain-containing protein [Halobacterium litoreum]